MYRALLADYDLEDVVVQALHRAAGTFGAATAP